MLHQGRTINDQTMSRPTKRASDNSSSSVPPEESNSNCSIPVATSTLEADTNRSTTTTNSNSYVSTGGPRTLSNTPTAILRSHIPETVDVFGFAIPPGQFILVQLVATLMLGFHGSILFLFAWIAYTLFHRLTSTQQRSGNSRNTGSGGGGRPGSSNIRGMKDLPKPPPKGG